ncbi:MAG: cytochrome-c oxidase, cbb3-type subunit III [Pseudomonadota bacterium]
MAETGKEDNAHSAAKTDAVTGKPTTGHEWDGIKELDTPLPKWWVYTFYATIVWAFLYTVVMPAWPYLTAEGWTYSKGLLGYAQRHVVRAELGQAEETRAAMRAQILSIDTSAILADPQLLAFATASGAAAFGDNCAGCHGQGAQGFPGFPNLQDDEWLWGGDIEAIETTIRHGVRWEGDADTRLSMMPRFLADGLLRKDQIADVVQHVLALSGAAHDAGAAARGAVLFAEQCAACHGEGGEGNTDLGAPPLNNAIWLYGGDKATLARSVSYARAGVMPAWGGRLDEATIKELAVYVASLGGGMTDAR